MGAFDKSRVWLHDCFGAVVHLEFESAVRIRAVLGPLVRAACQAARKHLRVGLALLFVLLLLRPLYTVTSALQERRSDQVISEFMAANVSTLADEDGDYPDWIEVHNQAATAVELGGWYLTDADNDLTKWRVPPTVLAPDGYLVVFASGKDRAVAGSELHTNFGLKSSGEYLALVEPDGRTVAWEHAPDHAPDQSPQLEGVSYSRLGGYMRRRRVVPEYRAQFQDVSYGLDGAGRARHFLSPSPGRANGTDALDRGPILSLASHTPERPAAGDALAVTVLVQEAFAPVGNVTLTYRVMYGEAVTVPMFDDGEHGDGARGDGIYGAIILGEVDHADPERDAATADVPGPGEMVRYHFTAQGQDNHTSRWPLFHDPAGSPRYFGTVIADPGIDSALPVLHWFTQDVGRARSLMGTRAQVYYDGVFYDNVYVRGRGYSSRAGWPKKSFKIEFNTGYPFRFSPDAEPVKEFDLNNTYSDKAYIRQPLAWETYRDAGVPYCISFPMRVQQNGTFHSVAIYVEHPDEQFLERLGLDPDGAFYKMFSGADSATSRVEKKTRRDEDHSDLQALLDGIDLEGEERTAYLFDHLNVPAIVNYLAVTALMHDTDCATKNYYLYRDTEGTGEWTFVPWDKDLTFGRVFDGHVLNDGIWADSYPQSHPFNLGRNIIINALYDTPVIREMYLRRLRTVMDEHLQSPETPIDERSYERRLDEFVVQLQPDADLDTARWPLDWGSPQTFSQAIDILKRDYLEKRRIYLYDTLGAHNGGIIPEAQPVTVTVEFGKAVESDPTSGDQDEEYFTLVNPTRYAIDISGWAISGDVQYTLQPGTVIPAGWTLYVSPDVAAFRDRDLSPRGGESRFVQGNYQGRLSNRWGVLRLHNASGIVVDHQFHIDLDLLR